MNRSLTSLVLGLCAATAITTSAFAAPLALYGGDETVTRVVHLGDVDLRSEAGARVAALRIRLAAEYVCGGDIQLTRRSADFLPCRHGAIDRALASLNAPLVSAALGRTATSDVAER